MCSTVLSRTFVTVVRQYNSTNTSTAETVLSCTHSTAYLLAIGKKKHFISTSRWEDQLWALHHITL